MRFYFAAVAMLLASPVFGQAINFGGGGVVGTNPTVSTLTTGTLLDVSASVSADRRYVTMNMNPSFSTLDGIDTFGAGNFVNGLPMARGVGAVPFRPAVVGNVTFVENDKTLLATEVAAVTMKDVSLKLALRKLADATNKNIAFGARAFEQAGVDIAKPHTFVLAADQGTLKSALLALIKDAAPDVDVVITTEDNVVQVTTQAAADNQMVTKLYYLEDLIARLPRIVSAQTDLRTLQQDGSRGKEKASADGPMSLGSLALSGSAVVGRGAASSGLADVSASEENAATQTAKVNRDIPLNIGKPYATDIVEMITSTVRPEIWKNHGGKYAEVTVSGNRVMVRAPASVHAILDGPKVYNPNAVPMYLNYGTR